MTAGANATYTSELPLAQWAVDDVVAWLRSLGLGAHAPVFVEVRGAHGRAPLASLLRNSAPASSSHWSSIQEEVDGLSLSLLSLAEMTDMVRCHHRLLQRRPGCSGHGGSPQPPVLPFAQSVAGPAQGTRAGHSKHAGQAFRPHGQLKIRGIEAVF